MLCMCSSLCFKRTNQFIRKTLSTQKNPSLYTQFKQCAWEWTLEVNGVYCDVVEILNKLNTITLLSTIQYLIYQNDFQSENGKLKEIILSADPVYSFRTCIHLLFFVCVIRLYWYGEKRKRLSILVISSFMRPKKCIQVN